MSDGLRVGVVGLGDIAQKAYLPVLGATAGVELQLMTRDGEKLRRVGERFGAAGLHGSLDSLLAADLDAAFVHAATEAHVPLVSALLAAGVPVFVDKPLDYSYEGATQLVELAEERRLSLMVGFNRRFAPEHAALLEHPRDLVLLQKNRSIGPEAARTFVFDDFVHVVDTLRFLAPGEVTRTEVRYRAADGLLEHVVLELGGDGFTAIGIMNRCSGSTEELLEVSGQGRKLQVSGLADVVEHGPDGLSVRRRNDWAAVGRLRGFEQMCEKFLGAVRRGEVLSARDALVTHEICERIVRQVEQGE